MRLFVAVDLPDEARQAIAVRQKLWAGRLSKSKGALKLIDPLRMHLTLLFIGEVPEARVPAIVESMNAPAGMAPFDVTFGGVGVFPPRGAPRVLWIGITDGAARLEQLQREIAQRVRTVDIAFDDRPFHPHLTLGRWRGADRRRPSEVRRSTPERLRRDIAALERSDRIARVRVTRATLYQSRLSSSGPAYTTLAHANLADKH
jgi:RNA 2',3'-cyclic 3'-phosphodiesterase